MKIGQIIPKRVNIKFRRRVITQKESIQQIKQNNKRYGDLFHYQLKHELPIASKASIVLSPLFSTSIKPAYSMIHQCYIAVKATNLPSSLLYISPELHYSNDGVKMNSNKMECNALIACVRYTEWRKKNACF
jgi:hypothetical protein